MLNSWIYIYYIKDDLLTYDRTVSRKGPLGLALAKRRVEELERKGLEAFYTIGTLTRTQALS